MSALYDSEAALRLVDSALGELQAGAQAPVATTPASSAPAFAAPTAPVDLPGLLLKAYGEISSVLASLRQSRDAIAEASVAKIQQTNAKISEVTSATEVATIDILNSLDRAQGLVDELDTLDAGSADSPASAVRARLRDELFQVTGCLQFQDITTQQLNHASSVLVETEQRLGQLAEIFDPGFFGIRIPEVAAVRQTFDPAASTANAEVRQALADAIFTSR